MARDPNRIYKFCNQLAALWVTYCSYWRFGQLIHNVFYARCGDDPFYLEEDEAMKKMEQYFNIALKQDKLRDDEKVMITKEEYQELLRYRSVYEDFHG